MVPEGRDGDAHPVVERQGAEQSVELSFAVGAVQTKDPGFAACDVKPPEANKVPFVHQLGRGSRFGLLAVFDLRLWDAVRNVDFELDQEFHERPPPAPDSDSTAPRYLDTVAAPPGSCPTGWRPYEISRRSALSAVA
jgi:hypothetical protein